MNTRSTFDVLFYVKRQAPLKDGSLSVMCKITVNGTKSCFSCKTSTRPEIWEGGKAVGRSDEAKTINRELGRIEESVRSHYRKIVERDSHVMAEKVKNAHLGLAMQHETLLKVYEQFLLNFEKMVEAGMRSESSLWKYQTVYGHLKESLKKRYRLNDIGLKDIAPAFITDFEIFLKTDKECSHSTVAVYMIPLRKMITIAQQNRILIYDPFCEYKISPEEKTREHLNSKEIKALMTIPLRSPQRELTRDLFIFCSFTGLAFVDLYALRKEDIRRDGDGHIWIVKKHEKTEVESVIRLMDVPKKILEKYDGLSENGRVFPVPLYKTLMYHIKDIAKKCDIEKNVTWHIARHNNLSYRLKISELRALKFRQVTI